MVTKAIIFDMGGVLINLDLERSLDEFIKIGYKDIRAYLNSYHQKGIFGMLEGGELDEEEVYCRLAEKCRPGVTEEEMRYALVSILDGTPPHLLELLEKLKKDYALYVLSNNNPITVKEFESIFAAAGMPVNEIFAEKFFSFELKMQKPSPEIFQYVLDHVDARPEEILFIDDSADNLKVASKFGMRVALKTPDEDLEELIDKYI